MFIIVGLFAVLANCRQYEYANMDTSRQEINIFTYLTINTYYLFYLKGHSTLDFY